MPWAPEGPNTDFNVEHRIDQMITLDAAELILFIKGCSQHWLKGAIGLKPITLCCPLTPLCCIFHEQSFPAPSPPSTPGWLADSLLALDLFTYLLMDANFSCGVYPHAQTYKAVRERRDWSSLSHFSWMSDEARTHTTYLKPPKDSHPKKYIYIHFQH